MGYNKEYYEKHKEKFKEYTYKYRKNHKEYMKELNKKYRKNKKELEQELKEANESITWWSNRFKAVEDLCNKYEKEHKTTFEEWKKYIEANKKAIEYIKWDMDKNEEYIDYCNFKDNYEKLLNILQGSDNNE